MIEQKAGENPLFIIRMKLILNVNYLFQNRIIIGERFPFIEKYFCTFDDTIHDALIEYSP